MIELEGKLIDEVIFKKEFVCDLNACKGSCCVQGDSGAPLEQIEKEYIEKSLEFIKPFMRETGINEIDKNGVSYKDIDGEQVTTLINGNECAFVYFDETNTAKCSIEKAYREERIDFNKPISCHLYPIRIKKLKYYDALSYHKWEVCEPACDCGKNLNVTIFRFLKEPLIRKYGEEFYSNLELVEKELQNKR